MERTQQWQREGEEITSQRGGEESDPKQEELQQHISQPIVEQIEDDLTTLHNKQNQTPLCFRIKIGKSYLLSYNKSEMCCFMVRYAVLAIFVVAVQAFVQTVSVVGPQTKIALICVCVVQIISFIVLYFLDPGTLFEDQPEKLSEQRLYCQTCRVYKRHKSKHCKYCIKCVKGYDHHCSFFGKCVGRRNYLLYCIFVLASGANAVGSFWSLAYTLFTSVMKK